MADKGMIGKIIENYRIELVLGQGGMAVVYKATDLKLQRQVAIKIMHPHLASQNSFQQRFLQEARAAASLDHPNIIRVLSFNNTENNLFLVMELIIGGNLRQYVKRLHEENKFVDYQEAIEVIRQLSDALDYAHRQGMVHRDLKPDNVILKPEPDGERLNYRPVVTDFGLAKLTSSGENAITDQQRLVRIRTCRRSKRWRKMWTRAVIFMRWALCSTSWRWGDCLTIPSRLRKRHGCMPVKR